MYIAMPARPGGVPGGASWLTNWSLMASRKASRSLAGKISSSTWRATALVSVPVMVGLLGASRARLILMALSFSLMCEEARPKRRYDATGRRVRAEATRDRVVEAASRVFLAHGYAGATIPAIAAEAEVALQTVYRAAPGKAGLLAVAVTAAVAGGSARAVTPVEERPAIRAIMEEPDPSEQLRLYAHTQPGIWERVGPLLRVLEAAAVSEPGLRRL